MSIFLLQFVAYRPPLVEGAYATKWRGPLATSKPNNRSTLQLLHSTLGLYGNARPHENCCVKFSVKKLMPQFWAPIDPRAPPHCGVCGVSSYATGCRGKKHFCCCYSYSSTCIGGMFQIVVSNMGLSGRPIYWCYSNFDVAPDRAPLPFRLSIATHFSFVGNYTLYTQN